MRIGVDLDNTIVCYDGIFRQAALELGLTPLPLKGDKITVRDYLRLQDKEEDWIHLQGHIYGPGMQVAKPYDGAQDFIRVMNRSAEIFIISHRTRHPYGGKKYDLHAAASRWLEDHSIIGSGKDGIKIEQVFFELTLEAKVNRIKQCQCTHFIDDLPRVLDHREFPTTVSGILFDTSGKNSDKRASYQSLSSWSDIRAKFQKYELATK